MFKCAGEFCQSRNPNYWYSTYFHLSSLHSASLLLNTFSASSTAWKSENGLILIFSSVWTWEWLRLHFLFSLHSSHSFSINSCKPHCNGNEANPPKEKVHWDCSVSVRKFRQKMIIYLMVRLLVMQPVYIHFRSLFGVETAIPNFHSLTYPIYAFLFAFKVSNCYWNLFLAEGLLVSDAKLFSSMLCNQYKDPLAMPHYT